MSNARTIARGIVFVGFLTSSPAVDTASNPMNEKKMPPVAAHTPWAPKGAKSARLLEFQPWSPITMNMIRTAILTSTMMAFAVADSLAPRTNSSTHNPTSTMAGRLMIPGSLSQGAADK